MKASANFKSFQSYRKKDLTDQFFFSFECGIRREEDKKISRWMRKVKFFKSEDILQKCSQN